MTDKKSPKITLSTPLKHGGEEISEVTLLEPRAGHLRGLKMLDVMRMDVNALLTLLPRISQPVLDPEALEKLGAYDLSALMTETVAFFAPPEEAVGNGAKR